MKQMDENLNPLKKKEKMGHCMGRAGGMVFEKLEIPEKNPKYPDSVRYIHHSADTEIRTRYHINGTSLS